MLRQFRVTLRVLAPGEPLLWMPGLAQRRVLPYDVVVTRHDVTEQMYRHANAVLDGSGLAAAYTGNRRAEQVLITALGQAAIAMMPVAIRQRVSYFAPVSVSLDGDWPMAQDIQGYGWGA